MSLNEQKGNMYDFVTHTWNVIKGECSHDCDYCYMKIYKQKPIRLDRKEFNTDLGKNNIIFIGSSTDMFANDVPKEWIIEVLNFCLKFDNTYLFQSKNPKRFLEFIDYFPKKTILGTTIETDRVGFEYNALSVLDRTFYMKHEKLQKFRRMVTIEPIIDFDVLPFVRFMKQINPEFINIGADSKGNNLPEPTNFKIKCLINELEKFTNVNLKKTLYRIYDDNFKEGLK